jgi:hypothetical protein
MILPRYQPNFEQLTQEQAVYLASAMHIPENDNVTGRDLYEIADSAGLDQADVVMTLATDSSIEGIQVVEALIGRPITRPTKQARAPRSTGPRRSVSVRRSDPRKITYVSPTNPKKQGSASHDRFALYQIGMTIDEFVRAGGTMGDVKWDAERDFIKIEGAE